MGDSLITKVRRKYRDLFIPWIMHFELTYRCNLHCQHCYVVPEKVEPELEYGEVIRIIQQIRELGTPAIAFSGGEIFLRNDILKILEFAAPNFILILLTNGTLITPEVASKLKKLRVAQVEVSLYAGRAQIHDKITGVAGSFDRTMNGLKALKKEGIHTVIKCLVMKENINEYAGLKKIAESLQARLQVGWLIIPKTDGSTKPLEYAVDDKDYDKYFSKWMDKKPDVEVERETASNNFYFKGREPCTAGKSVCSISPYGIVHPCVTLPWNLGSLRKRSLKEIWLTDPCEKLKRLRALRISDFKQCSNCDIRSLCTPCLGKNYLDTGDILKCSADYCRQAHHFVRRLTQERRLDYEEKTIYSTGH